MRKRSSTPPRDPIEAARRLVDVATGRAHVETEPVSEQNPVAVALGRLGGLKGGKARAKSLSKKKRTEIAKKAAAKRWQD